MNKGNLFIISGPSGSGKDTVLAGVFKKFPELKFSISVITRPMREGETPDGKYRFISVDEFKKMIDNGELLEHNVFVGNYYGTPKDYVINQLNNGFDVIVEVDVNGAEQIREKMPEAVSVFILPPSFDVLKERLSKRGTETTENLNKRLNASLIEIEKAKDYDFVVINDNIDDAIDGFSSIIKAVRQKTAQNLQLIDNIINK